MGLKKADSASILRTPVGEIIWHIFSPLEPTRWRVGKFPVFLGALDEHSFEPTSWTFESTRLGTVEFSQTYMLVPWVPGAFMRSADRESGLNRDSSKPPNPGSAAVFWIFACEKRPFKGLVVKSK